MEKQNLEKIKECVMRSIEDLAMKSDDRGFIIDAYQAGSVIATFLDYENYSEYVKNSDADVNLTRKAK